jgi:hypothetical protein
MQRCSVSARGGAGADSAGSGASRSVWLELRSAPDPVVAAGFRRPAEESEKLPENLLHQLGVADDDVAGGSSATGLKGRTSHTV